MTDETCWPEGFADIGGQTFDWVRRNKPDWVDFTLNEMKTPSGLFLKWHMYLLNKRNGEKVVAKSDGVEIHEGNRPSKR